MSDTTSIQTLGDFVAEFTLKDAPEDVVDEAKRQVLDALTGAFAASHYPGGSIPAQVAQSLEVSGTSLGRTATVFSSGQQASAATAAFANAQCSIAMDVASNLFFSQGLPGVTVFPALAVAERDHLSGAALLESLIPAYEVAARVALSFPAHWRPPSVMEEAKAAGTPEPPYFGFRWIGFGGVTATAKIMRLDSDAIANAIALMGSAVPLPHAVDIHHPTMSKYGILGIVAWSAIVTSELASNGFTGDIDQFDQGRFHGLLGSYLNDPDVLQRGLGSEWMISEANYKRYPVGTHNNQGLHAIEQLVQKEHLNPLDIESITISRAIGTGGGFANPHPQNYVETEFSFPYQCAAVIYGRPHREWGTMYNDQDLLRLAERVKMQQSERTNAEFENEWKIAPVRSPWWFRTLINVEADGRSFETWSDYGKPSNEELANKFRHWAGGVISSKGIEMAIDLVAHLEDLEDVSELAQALTLR